MRMNRETDIGSIAAHFNRKRGFSDQIASIRTDDAGTNDAMSLLVEDQFGETLVAPKRE